MQFRILTGGTETILYQKTLPDGSMASLSETTAPIKRIRITYGDKSYELYLEHRVAIDTQFVYQGARSQAASILSMLGGKAAESSKILGTVQRDGKECYEIESTLLPDVVASLVKAAPPETKNMMPAKFRYVIEKNTNLMVEMETVSQNGSPLSKVEYKDVTLRSDLSDDLFLLPPGLELKTPKSLEEYMTLVVDMMSPKVSKPTLQPPRRPGLVHGPAGEIQPRSMSTGRLIALVVSVMAVIVLSAALVRRRMTKRYEETK